MTTLLLPRADVTTALVAMLRDQIGGGIRVYDHDVYDEPGYPYAVVLRMDDPESSGPPFANPEADGCVAVQIDSVGRRRDQAEKLADRVMGRLLPRADDGTWLYDIAVPGWVCMDRRRVSGGGVEPQGPPKARIYASQVRYELEWTPA